MIKRKTKKLLTLKVSIIVTMKENNYKEQKDIQILAKSSGDKELTLQAQTKITQLTIKYRQVVKVSGLPNQLKTRANVVGYKRINVANM